MSNSILKSIRTRSGIRYFPGIGQVHPVTMFKNQSNPGFSISLEGVENGKIRRTTYFLSDPQDKKEAKKQLKHLIDCKREGIPSQAHQILLDKRNH